MKSRIVSLCAALSLLGSWSANAALIQVDFSLNSTGWYNSSGTPFSLGSSPSLAGTLLVDNELSGIGSLLDFSLTTGTVSWGLSDFIGATASSIAFNSAGEVSSFSLHGFQNLLGSMYIYSSNTFLVQEYASNELNFCNGCVSFSQREVASSVPEPGTLALLGIGLLGLAARRRRMS